MEGLTNGAPMKAISKGILRSLVRHWTHGSRAKVVIPENIASAVTEEGIKQPSRKHGLSQQLTFPYSTIDRLGKFNIIKWYLIMVMPVVVGFNANKIKQQGEGRENL